MFTLLQNAAPPSSAEPQARISGIPARGQSPGHDRSAEFDSIVSLRLRFSEQNQQPTLSLRRPPKTTTPAVSKTASPTTTQGYDTARQLFARQQTAAHNQQLAQQTRRQ